MKPQKGVSEDDTEGMKKDFISNHQVEAKVKCRVRHNFIYFSHKIQHHRFEREKMIIELNISIEMTMKTYDRFGEYGKIKKIIFMQTFVRVSE